MNDDEFRQLLALVAMHGLMHCHYDPEADYPVKDVADIAVRTADAVIARMKT